MKKELLIIKYKINIDRLSSAKANELIYEFVKNNSLRNDQELEKDYLIREIFIPICNNDSDVEIIYPIPKYQISPEINKLADEITLAIKNDPKGKLIEQWKRLVRELKLNQINESS